MIPLLASENLYWLRLGTHYNGPAAFVARDGYKADHRGSSMCVFSAHAGAILKVASV